VELATYVQVIVVRSAMYGGTSVMVLWTWNAVKTGMSNGICYDLGRVLKFHPIRVNLVHMRVSAVIVNATYRSETGQCDGCEAKNELEDHWRSWEADLRLSMS
jgi:hypothetical protein